MNYSTMKPFAFSAAMSASFAGPDTMSVLLTVYQTHFQDCGKGRFIQTQNYVERVFFMSVKLLAVKCPECGAYLDVEENRRQLYCSFCGAKVIISNDNEYIYRKVDEARIVEAEVKERIRLKELEVEATKRAQYEPLRKVLTCLWIASIIIVAGICLYLAFFSDDALGGLSAFNCLFWIGGPVVGGGAYMLFKVLPEKYK